MRPGASRLSDVSTVVDDLDALDVAVGTKAVPTSRHGSRSGARFVLATTHG
jgi:hypothetical protein